MRFIALAALFLLAAGPAAAAAVAVTPANLGAALAAAKPGDTLTLSGTFGEVTFTNRTFQPALKLDLAAATLTSLQFTGSEGFEVSGGTIHATSAAPAVAVMNTRHVRFQGVSLTDPGDHYGFDIRGSSDVSVLDSHVEGAKVGIELWDVDGAKIVGNKIRAVTIDGMDITSARNVLVEGNSCADNNLTDNHHPDCIQMWTDAMLPQSENITLRRNTATGPTQGFDDFGGDKRGILNLVVEDNTAEISYPNGVSILESPGAIVRNNHVKTLPGSKFRVSVRVAAPGAVACGNTAEPGAGKPGWSDGSCK
jgi:hypothetical protein